MSDREPLEPVFKVNAWRKPSRVRLSQEHAEHALAWWANRLGLDDWSLGVQVLGQRQMHANTMGTVNAELSHRYAMVYLLDVDDADVDFDPFDMEQVLVHEMLHVSTRAWREWCESKGDRSKVELFVTEEQPIDVLAWAFVRMRRENPGQAMPWDAS